MRIDELKKNFWVEIRWRAFPLHPEIPPQGVSLEDYFAGRDYHIAPMLERLKKAAIDLGLPLEKREKIYNSRLAQELGKWAETRGKGDEFHNAVFHSYYAEGKNIAETEILASLAVSAGLDGKAAREVLETRSFKQAVDDDWALSRQWGITAVPTFVIDKDMVVGAQSYETLEGFLLRHKVPEKKQ